MTSGSQAANTSPHPDDSIFVAQTRSAYLRSSAVRHCHEG